MDGRAALVAHFCRTGRPRRAGSPPGQPGGVSLSRSFDGVHPVVRWRSRSPPSKASQPTHGGARGAQQYERWGTGSPLTWRDMGRAAPARAQGRDRRGRCVPGRRRGRSGGGVAGRGPASAAEAAPPSSADLVSVIVRELAGTGNGPERAVEAFGGTVGRHLEIINGFTATVPSDRLDALRATPGISDVTEDAGLELSGKEVEDQAGQTGSLYTIANQVTGAAAMWDAGYTGQGVDVAVIDSGVVPVR